MYIEFIGKLLKVWDASAYRQWLGEAGRESRSGRLAALLRRHKGVPSKDEIFQRVFDQKYIADRDYLLRNELSLLRRKLEARITAGMALPVALDKPYFIPLGMSRWCMENQLNEEALHYAEKALELAEEAGDWPALLGILKMVLLLSPYSKTGHDERLEYMQRLAEKHRYYLRQLVGEEVRYADFMQAARRQFSAQLRRTQLDFALSETVYFHPDDAPSPVAEYYRCKALGFSASGREAVAHFRAALQNLDPRWEAWMLRQEWLTCMSAIARELSLLGEWEEAEQVFRETLTHPGLPMYSGRRSLQINYCTTLVKLKKYKAAIDILEAMSSEDLEPVVEERLFTLKTICYVFYEDPERIRSILPKDLGAYDLSLRIYYRLLYTMYYLVKGDTELAEREIVNMASARGLEQTPYPPLVTLFRRYLHLLSSLAPGETPSAAQRKTFQKLLDRTIADHPDVTNMLPGLWLVEKWEALSE